ncbi:MAG: transglutaminase-like domain-containing protein, partial [Gammaproteobacteria bacterium]|nr:transglutaminase-like domain-containing protein [Gammaproteobacteria bacterium]
KLSYSIEVLNAQVGAQQVGSIPRSYLSSASFIESDHPKIIETSKALQQSNDAETAKAIYAWVIANVKDAGYTSQDKGALYALENGKGDCTEYMYLVIALARAAGIPARPVGGYVYKQNTIVEPADYHNWAELYFSGRWYTVDAQKKAFGDVTGAYVAMRYLDDQEITLAGNSHRFSVTNQALKVKMLK